MANNIYILKIFMKTNIEKKGNVFKYNQQMKML